MTLHTIWAFFYWLWVASEVLLVIITRTRRSSGNVRDRGSILILWPTIFFSIFFATYYADTHPHTIFAGANWVRPFGLIIFLAGLAIRWIAILSLGRSFSVNVAIHSTQTVYKRGLYRWVRHPSYTGMLIIFFAIGLESRNWISLAIMLIFPTLALLYRIHVEEAALLGAFGEDYASYRTTTSRLIPGIY
jgi:protein-S-isoprenylcysteine O-methyltransferase Ste14